MLTIFQSITLGAAQGVTELFPISSLGHSVILPSLLNWNIVQSDPVFVTFLVATHFATALVLFCFFWDDWKKMIIAFFRTVRHVKVDMSDTYEKLVWLLILGTVPAGIIGFVLEKKLETLFASPTTAAFFLIINGLMLYGAEKYLRKKQFPEREAGTSHDANISQLSWMQSIKVGCMQALALIPGLSRTGSALTGGLFVGLSREDAARFSFLLATPIIGAAAVLKLPSLVHSSYAVTPTLLGALAAGIAAYFSVKYLTKYFKTKSLNPFAVYCVLGGIISLIVFALR
jgi:undecaprenyl-diphosphatase